MPANFFYFLGTVEGVLLKNSIELMLFVLVAYMLSSEYLRERTKELKFLFFAFTCLSFHRALVVVYLFLRVFKGMSELKYSYNFSINIIGNFIEIIAIILLIHAFLYKIYEKKYRIYHPTTKRDFLLTVLLTAVVGLHWYFKLKENPFASFSSYDGELAFITLKLVFLINAMMVLLLNMRDDPKWLPNIMAAFFVYSVPFALQFINFVFFSVHNDRLRVIQHPFPIMAVLLFTRIVYLKLVDKATLKDQLKESRKQYLHEKELSGMKDDFISTVSHELRTPLTSMQLYTSILLSQKVGKLNRKQKDALEIISLENKRLANLINDILSLSKLESRRERLNVQEMNVFELCDDPLYKEMVKEKNLAFVNNIPKGLKVNADPEKFKQVFINLLSNAVKFTEKGRVEVSANKGKKHWEFRIKDTGIGIPSDKAERLFDKFYQGEEFMTREKSKGGTGLGLSIVRQIVELHKGEITVNSMVGEGTEFVLRFPEKLCYPETGSDNKTGSS